MTLKFPYYHWRTYNAYDGSTLVISEIDEIMSIKYINDTEYIDVKSASVSVVINNITVMTNEEFIFETKQKAIMFALKQLRNSISYIELCSDIVLPKNPEEWLIKATHYMDCLFKKYSQEYPEIFI